MPFVKRNETKYADGNGNVPPYTDAKQKRRLAFWFMRIHEAALEQNPRAQMVRDLCGNGETSCKLNPVRREECTKRTPPSLWSPPRGVVHLLFHAAFFCAHNGCNNTVGRTLSREREGKIALFVALSSPITVTALGINSIFCRSFVAALFRDIVQEGEPAAIRAKSGHGDGLQNVDRCNTRS